MKAIRREHYDMAKLRQCTLSNDTAMKSTCGDYWGGDIGNGSNAAAVAVRDGFMYARCVSDVGLLRQSYEFNVAPSATVSTDNASTTLSTDVLIAPNFNAMLSGKSYLSNATSAPYVTLAFDQVYPVADIAIAFGTKTQWIPSYFEMRLLDVTGNIIAAKLGSALDTVVSTNPFYNGIYWWSFPQPLKASQFTFSCSSNQQIELRNISVWAVDLNQGSSNCACFMNTADAALLGYLPVCDSASCKQINIMTTAARVQMNDGKTCNKTVFNCSQILNISPASQATVMQNVTLAQQCGPAAKLTTADPPAAPPPAATKPEPESDTYTYVFIIFMILAALGCVAFYVSHKKKKVSMESVVAAEAADIPAADAAVAHDKAAADNATGAEHDKAAVDTVAADSPGIEINPLGPSQLQPNQVDPLQPDQVGPLQPDQVDQSQMQSGQFDQSQTGQFDQSQMQSGQLDQSQMPQTGQL